MLILGLGGWDHDSNSAIIGGAADTFVGEEERFSRQKHQGQQYALSIDRCLRFNMENPVTHGAIAFADKDIFNGIIRCCRQAHVGSELSFDSVEHHLSHSACAFYSSGYDQAIVVTIDGYGDGLSSTASVASRDGINRLWQVPYPHSLGALWMSTSYLLGFGMREAGKVMGLASYGSPRYADLLLDRITLHRDGRYEFRLDICTPAQFLHSDHSLFQRVMGPPRQASSPILQVHMDVAASLQKVTEHIVLHMLKGIYATHPYQNLCLSGGVALNSALNGHILRSSPFSHVHVPPNPGDSGTGIGSALYVASVLGARPGPTALASPYLGSEYTQESINDLLNAQSVAYKSHERVEPVTARLLTQGKIVGWFQGRSEIGPRALGNRSILADPRNPMMKDLLNSRVKFREWFRPFAPAVLAPQASQWFETEQESPYMSFVSPVVEGLQSQVPAITHIDGTARLQTVRQDQNPLFYRLIDEFCQITGVPMVLNTSFNTMGEPIVDTPEDALRCFFRSGIDVLVMGHSIVSK